MTASQFISKAIEGGWEMGGMTIDEILINPLHIPLIIIDPKAWQAVGKVEGWITSCQNVLDDQRIVGDAWRVNMLLMIDALAEGKSIEDFIKTL